MRNTDAPTTLASAIAALALTASTLIAPPMAGAAIDADGGEDRSVQHLNTGNWLDTQDRQAVINSYNNVYSVPTPEMGWTGDYDTCDAGTISPQYRQATINRINWFRSIAGVPAVTEDLEASAFAQNAAIIASTSSPLTHNPTPDATCYTEAGKQASKKSNLSRGSNGPKAIDRYMLDWGVGNEEVGHRNWILSPTAQQFGTADVPRGTGDQHGSNALRTIEDDSVLFHSATPTVREEGGFVAWPARGYNPSEVVFERWSFGLRGADFANATVTTQLIENGVATSIASPIIHKNSKPGSAPYEIIVWEPALAFPTVNNANGMQPLPTPALDQTYRITISNVGTGSTTRTFTYDVTVIGDQPSQRPVALPAPQGPAVSNRAFTNRAFNDFLDRDATEAELDDWSTRITLGATRGELVTELAQSTEWIGVIVERMYQGTLSRPSDAGGRAYWTHRVQNGLTVAQMAAQFYSSDEYVNSVTTEEWITDLYDQLLGRTPDAAGLAFYVAVADESSPEAVALSIYQSDESRRARVQVLYQQLLGRGADQGGETYWAERLLDGNDLALAAEHAASPEYFDNATR